MSEFAHTFTQEARLRGSTTAKGGMSDNGMSNLRRGNREAVYERVRAGKGSGMDRHRVLIFICEDRKEGRFSGTQAEWLRQHQIDQLPEPDSESAAEKGQVPQQLLDVTVEIAGPEFAWALMVIAGQIPILPRRNDAMTKAFY